MGKGQVRTEFMRRKCSLVTFGIIVDCSAHRSASPAKCMQAELFAQHCCVEGADWIEMV